MSTTEAELEPLWEELTPPLRNLAAELEGRVHGTHTLVEWSSSADYPLTLFLTVAPFEDDEPEDLTFEITLKLQGSILTMSVELVSESGDIVGPTLTRPFSIAHLPDDIKKFIAEAGRDLQKYVFSYVDTVDIWFNPSHDRSNVAAAANMVETAADMIVRTEQRRSLVELPHHELAVIFASELKPGEVELRSRRPARFDFVSDDKTIVGEVKRFTSPRGSLESLTAAIWRLQEVRGAERRFLIIAPHPGKGLRWIETYGIAALRGVELWTVEDSEHLAQIA